MNQTVYRTPAGYLGALFLFWGFTLERPVLGAVLAVVTEGSVLVKRKWELTRDDFIRISDISSVVMLAALGLIYFTHERWQVMRQFVIWLPVIHLPLLIAQKYSTADRIVIGTRLGRRKGKEPHVHRPFNITWVYAVLILFAAAAANNRSVWFFPSVALFIAWGLAVYRGRRYSFATWAGAMAAAFVLALSLAVVLNRTYLYAQERIMEYYSLWLTRLYADPFKSSTAIGDVSGLKLSGRILLRVRPEFGKSAPFYLTDGVYETYTATSWYNREATTRRVPIEENGQWTLHETPSGLPSALSITAWLPRGKGTIPIPRGTHAITRLNVAGLVETAYGAVLVEEGPELVDYTTFYLSGHLAGTPPGPRDLSVPSEELPGLDATLDLIGPLPADPAAIAAAVERHLLFNFRYQLPEKRYGVPRAPITEFLLTTRTGHCEYFATAMTLLLRRAGIPARYVTGFVADEWDPFEEAYVVRERHGHAWVTAWINDRWVDFDPTPPGWITQESLSASIFEPVSDFFNYFRLRYEQIRRVKNEKLNRALVMEVALLAAWLVYRVYARRKRRVAMPEGSGTLRSSFPRRGADSPFPTIAHQIETLGISRDPDESYRRWIERSRSVFRSRGETPEILFDETLDELLTLHERYRFDPGGLDDATRRRLFDGTAAWLARYRGKPN